MFPCAYVEGSLLARRATRLGPRAGGSSQSPWLLPCLAFVVNASYPIGGLTGWASAYSTIWRPRGAANWPPSSPPSSITRASNVGRSGLVYPTNQACAFDVSFSAEPVFAAIGIGDPCQA